jgi:hypothetical protein
MDPPSLAYWDETHGSYVAYLRCWINYRIRGFRRVTSEDFIRWSRPEVINYGDAESRAALHEHGDALRTRPGVTLMFAKRFVPDRKIDPAWPNPASPKSSCSPAVTACASIAPSWSRFSPPDSTATTGTIAPS